MVKARRVAERAILKINFREEQEKLNIWSAWLNLEYKFGTPSSLESVLARATQESNGKMLHLSLAQACFASGNANMAYEYLDRALKKYKKSKKVWSTYQRMRIAGGDHIGAKQLLQRSMQSLSRHKHIYVIKEFAFAEFEFGSQERGRNLLEDLVGSHPKRLDLWHVYVDREIKMDNILEARALFERMALLKLSTKKISALFKKWLQFEKRHGDEDHQRVVIEKAKRYRDSLMQ